jgi:hypothetical protein
LQKVAFVGFETRGQHPYTQVLFDYCPPEALDFDYRCQLLLQEILGYQVTALKLSSSATRESGLFVTMSLAISSCCKRFLATR